MHDRRFPRPNYLPFILSDLLLLALAGFFVWKSPEGLSVGLGFAAFCCVATGAWIGVAPFILKYKTAVRLAESERLATAVGVMKNLEVVQKQITNASNQWEFFQEMSGKTIKGIQEVGERMASETKEFFKVLENADRTEKNHLRLEVEKLRRAETDWLQVIVHIFDHIHALHAAAARSRHAGFAAQLEQFQNACRDASRRVGLVPFAPKLQEAFETRLHQLMDGSDAAADGAVISEVLAAGYTYQGQLLRRAVVQVGQPAPNEPGELTALSDPVDAQEPEPNEAAPSVVPPGQEELRL